MNDHSLDDLIIGEPSSVVKKSKGILVIIALVVIVLLAGILLSKMILGTSSDNEQDTDKNQTEFVSPELVPIKNGNNLKKGNDLKSMVKESLPKPSRQFGTLSENQPKKIVKQKINTSKVKQVKVPAKKPIKKPVQKPTQKPTKQTLKLFADGKPIYFVQIGAFNRDLDPKFLKKIKDAGFSYIVNQNEKTRQVRVGPYGSYAEAKAVLSDINSAIGIMGFVVKQKK